MLSKITKYFTNKKTKIELSYAESATYRNFSIEKSEHDGTGVVQVLIKHESSGQLLFSAIFSPANNERAISSIAEEYVDQLCAGKTYEEIKTGNLTRRT